MPLKYIFLDAGGTIIYPNVDLICEFANKYGYNLSPQDILKSFYETIFYYDNLFRKDGVKDSSVFIHLIPLLLNRLGIDIELGVNIRKKMREKENNLIWTYTTSEVIEGLKLLKENGFKLSVISNSDGTVEEQIKKAGLRKYFEKVYDSGIIGIEKPDPRIFIYALNDLNLKPSEVIYVGDIMMIDVLGANRAKIGAIHLDPLNLYQSFPGMHLKSIYEFSQTILNDKILEENKLYPYLEREG